MKKIVLADYIGNCDEDGKPIGHPVKVLCEYGKLLENDFQVDYILPMNMQGELEVQNVRYLPYFLNPNVQSSSKKLINVLKKMWNLIKVFRMSKREKIWFCNIDFYLFFYLFLFGKKDSYVICTMYRQNFGGDGSFGKIKDYVLKKALSKIDLIICSNENLQFPDNRCLFVPDYFYLPEKYEKYLAEEKEDKIVCLGTMGQNKCLKSMLDAFKNIEIKLEVCGKFSDVEQYEQLKMYESQYISINNKYLTEEEYLVRLGKARYCILPYNMALYNERTSGVILEAIFLNTIPITDKRLLIYNKLPGIGYQDFNEIGSLIGSKKNLDDFYKCAVALKQDRYDMDVIKKKMIEYLG